MYLFISDNTTDTKGLRYQLREGDLKKQNKTKKLLTLQRVNYKGIAPLYAQLYTWIECFHSWGKILVTIF